MKLVWAFLYNGIIYPLIFLLACLLSMFNGKLRQGISEHYQEQVIDPYEDVKTSYDVGLKGPSGLGGQYKNPISIGLEPYERLPIIHNFIMKNYILDENVLDWRIYKLKSS